MSYIEEAKRLIESLKEINYFKDDAKRNLEEVTPETLSKYAIVVEKNFNFDKSIFEYKPEKGLLVRINFSENLEYETEENYKQQYKKCRKCKNPCYKGEYTVKDFVELIGEKKFEPINFYLI